MDNVAYISLSRQAGLKRELNAIANNIANVGTTGFRREASIFAEQTNGAGADAMSMATMDRRYIDLSEGAVRQTGGALDFAIDGEGFFLVETEAGPALTRAGAFSMNEIGELVTPEGRRVLDEGGGPIVLPADAGSITATEDGAIMADGQPAGRLGVVTADPASLARIGDNLFRAEGGYEPSVAPRVRQHALEGSNVNAVVEMARLIEVQRTYEMGQKIVGDDDGRILRAVRELGQGQ